MRVLVLAAALLAVGGAFASPTLSLGSASAVSFVVVSGDDVPVRLLAGPSGSPDIGANETSADASLTSGILSDATANTTAAQNQWDEQLRARLTLVSASGSVSECTKCEVQVRCGGTTSSQIVVSGGVVTQSQGAWVTLGASGASCATWHVWLVGRGTVVADKEAVLSYSLDVERASGDSPRVSYFGMVARFQV